MPQYQHKRNCRLCGGARLTLAVPMRPSPVGDAFVSAARLHEEQPLFPLDCYLCDDCGHLQNLDVVNPEILFREYTYRTSASLGLVEHFRKYADELSSDFELNSDDLIVEIGSNDGSLLKAFKSKGMRVQGIDPALAIATQASNEGIPTIPDFFTSKIAEEIKLKVGSAKLFCANNVFAHMDNMFDVLKGIRTILDDDGVFVFEVSYIVDMVDNMVFDTIYHEHVSYHALTPLDRFFRTLDMSLFDVKRLHTKGGSIRCFAQPLSTGKRKISNNLSNLLADEARRGFMTLPIYQQWQQNIITAKDNLLSIIDEEIAAGKIVAGYGASTTTTTLIYNFELENRLRFLVDDNTIKQGMYSPRAHIPVLHPNALIEMKSDLVIILAWTYAEIIIDRNYDYLTNGGTFLVPLPEMKIVRHERL